MNKFFILLLLIVVYLFSSCRKDIQQESLREGRSLLSKKISFSNIYCLESDTTANALFDNQYKIIIYLDSVFCTPCAFDDITIWRSYIKILNELNTKIILICNHPNSQTVRSYMEEAQINLPILFDRNETFKKQNNLPKEQKFQTFVVDSSRTVIWVGSPVYNKESWKAFCKMMKAL